MSKSPVSYAPLELVGAGVDPIVLDTVRRIVAGEVAPRAARLDETSAVPDDSYQALASAEASMVKLDCTDLAAEVAAQATELLGQDRDRIDLGVERILSDAKVTQVHDGTNQVQSMLSRRDIRLHHGSSS